MWVTFDQLYPDAPEGFQVSSGDNDDGCIKLSEKRPCWNCGTPTAFVDLDFEAHLCSEECRDVKWNEYFEALKRRDD